MQSTFLTRLRAWFAQGNRATWTVFILFASTLFLKVILFNWTTVHSLLISSLWKNPVAFFAFWFGNTTAVLFLSAFVFVCKRQYWTIVVNALLDIWTIANIFYFKANGIFLTFDMIFMIDNMSGFWTSLYTYMGWDIVAFLLLTICYTALLFIFRIEKTNSSLLLPMVILLLFSFLTSFSANYYHTYYIYKTSTGWDCSSKRPKLNELLPFGYWTCYAVNDAWKDDIVITREYVQYYSFISYLPATIISKTIITPVGRHIELGEQTISIIQHYIKPSTEERITPKRNIVYILVESLESWTIEETCLPEFLPNVQALCNREHFVYCRNVVSQTRHGNSADGQMIGVTGLLPISDGVVCRKYADNIFPNFAHLYNASSIINPSSEVYNQSKMTKRYGFSNLIEKKKNEYDWMDEDVLQNVKTYCDTAAIPFCTLGITISSHVPFTYGAEHPIYQVPDMPPTMSAYLNSLHYTDSCIGALVDNILNGPLADNTVIIITGDHTIFRSETAFSDLTKYAQANNIDFHAGHTFTPLVIYSPDIEGNIQITDTCYQMDIFPTILHLIGAEDYYWHGFGVNLMDSAARHNRPVSEQEAYRLSDLMIRSDYFRTYMGIEE